jgi:NAD(P)-dependent dehydrogenase (short-subunit alcohol dehydrogenase family)
LVPQNVGPRRDPNRVRRSHPSSEVRSVTRPVSGSGGSYGTVDDIAAAVAHLAGDGGRYMSGTAITVDGGFAA